MLTSQAEFKYILGHKFLQVSLLPSHHFTGQPTMEIATIDVQIRGFLHGAAVEQRGKDVNVSGRHRHVAIGGKSLGPANETGHVNPTLEHAALQTAHAGVVSAMSRSIIGHEDDDCVVRELFVVEEFERSEERRVGKECRL